MQLESAFLHPRLFLNPTAKDGCENSLNLSQTHNSVKK